MFVALNLAAAASTSMFFTCGCMFPDFTHAICLILGLHSIELRQSALNLWLRIQKMAECLAND